MAKQAKEKHWQFKPGKKLAVGHGRPRVEKLTKEQEQEIKNIARDLQYRFSKATHDILTLGGEPVLDIINNKATEPLLRTALANIILKSSIKGDSKQIDTLLNRAIGPVKQRVDITTNDGSINPTNTEVVDKLKTEFKSLLQAKEEWQSQTSSEPGLLSSVPSSQSGSTQE